MDVRLSKGCDIPTSESIHVQTLTSYGICVQVFLDFPIPASQVNPIR